MQINPGGRLNTEDVVGRDNEIARYWGVLERQGLVISAERRIGKTHIVLKMRDECRSGYLPIYQDLESVHSTAELIRSIYGTVHRSLSTLSGLKAHIAKWSSLLPGRIAGVDLPTGDSAWQALLSEAFDDLIGIADDRIILMLWDEFPLMLHNLQRREGNDAAIQLLDFLRALRLARADRLRFLFTGSIGLHLVLRSLRKAGNTNAPVNDMHSLTVPPMAHRDTCDLAAALLVETRAAPAQIPDLASRIAGRGRWLSLLRPSMSSISSTNCGARLSPRTYRPPWTISSTTPTTPADFDYYVSRLSSYYAAEDRSLTLIVLDIMAGQVSPTPVPVLLNLCRHREPSLADERLREVLTVLAEDHYIEPRKSAGGAAYDFRWQLVKTWWKERRS